ncbi:MAG: cytochrome c [Gammaproteobacteria bacterium]|nr:cytochrome c [Gammaproteobacteria bacterium]
MLAAMLAVSIPAGSEESAAEKAGPGLGQPASDELVQHWNISVFPDGRCLPEGSGSVAQGEKIYNEQCITCHARAGAGGSGDRLARAEMGLTEEFPQKTIANYWPYATTLFDFIRRSMPMHNPGSLSDDETYALTAYLLSLDNVIPEDAVMNQDTLPNVTMPNRDGFIDVWQDDPMNTAR